PGGQHPADLLLPGHRRHAGLGHPARMARSPDPGGGPTVTGTTRAPDRAASPSAKGPGSPGSPGSIDAGVAPAVAEERVSRASNLTLVWWRFRNHRLAMASAVVLLGLYAVVLCPDFFSTQDPELTDARLAFIPVQRPHLLDGVRWNPWVPAVVGKRN